LRLSLEIEAMTSKRLFIIQALPGYSEESSEL
jgi:hypothetical protein